MLVGGPPLRPRCSRSARKSKRQRPWRDRHPRSGAPDCGACGPVRYRVDVDIGSRLKPRCASSGHERGDHVARSRRVSNRADGTGVCRRFIPDLIGVFAVLVFGPSELHAAQRYRPESPGRTHPSGTSSSAYRCRPGHRAPRRRGAGPPGDRVRRAAPTPTRSGVPAVRFDAKRSTELSPTAPSAGRRRQQAPSTRGSWLGSTRR